MNSFEIIGIVTTLKDEKSFTRLVMVSDFSDYQQTNSERCEGMEAIVEYTRADCSALQVGDVVELYYSKGYQGKAVLSGFKKIEKN